MMEGHFQELATFVHLSFMGSSLLIISVVYFIKNILFVISSNIIELGLMFPTLLLPSSHLILEKHKKICTPSSLLGMPGSKPSRRHVYPVC